MPRRNEAQEDVILETLSPPQFADMEEDDNIIREISLLTELGEGGDTTFKIWVYRVTGRNAPGTGEPYLFTIDGSEADTLRERLLKYTQPGTIARYRLRVIKHEGNKKTPFKMLDMSIEAPPAGTAPVVPVQSDASSFAQIVAEMNAQNTRMMEAMFQRLEQRMIPAASATPLDPFAMMERMTAIIANMRPPGGAGNDATGMMANVIELADKLSSRSSGSEKGMMDVVSDLINSPLLGELLAARGPQGALPPPQPKPQPALNAAAQSVPPAPSYSATPNNPQPITVASVLREKMLFLVDKAARGANTELYAEMMLDDLPQPVTQTILQTENIFQQILNIVPEVAPHQAWFTRLLDDMRAMVQDGATQTGAAPLEPSTINAH